MSVAGAFASKCFRLTPCFSEVIWIKKVRQWEKSLQHAISDLPLCSHMLAIHFAAKIKNTVDAQFSMPNTCHYPRRPGRGSSYL